MRPLVISKCLYTCESWTLTAELKKRTQTIDVRCFRRLLNILLKDLLALRKFKLMSPVKEAEIKMGWLRLKVFLFSKDNSTGQSKRKKEKNVDRRRDVMTISKSGQEWTLPAKLFYSVLSHNLGRSAGHHR